MSTTPPEKPDQTPPTGAGSGKPGGARRAGAAGAGMAASAAASKVGGGGLAKSARVLSDKSSSAKEKAEEGVAAGIEVAAAAAGSAIATPIVGKVAGTVAGTVARSKTGKKVGKWYVIAMASLAVFILFIGLTLVASLTATFVSNIAEQEEENSTTEPIGGGQCGPATPGTPIAGLTAEQSANANTIISTTMGRADMTPSDAVIAVMTAITESTLRNVNYGDTAGPDSRGLFQQRDSWGTLEQRMDPATATNLFLNALSTNTSRSAIPPWEAAQKVQRSAYSDGSNYRVKYAQAVALVTTQLTAEQMATTNSTQWLAAAGGEAWTPPSTDPGATPPPVQTCEGNSGVPSTGGNTGGIGSWGGHANGQIPDEAMCPVPFDPKHKMRCDASAALGRLNVEFVAAFGRNIYITDSYRSLQGQIDIKASWCRRGACNMAATPGTSNHGWALALDLGEGINTSYTTAQYTWMAANAPAYGFENPAWAKPGPGFQKREPWHWEYTRSES